MRTENIYCFDPSFIPHAQNYVWAQLFVEDMNEQENYQEINIKDVMKTVISFAWQEDFNDFTEDSSIIVEEIRRNWLNFMSVSRVLEGGGYNFEHAK